MAAGERARERAVPGRGEGGRRYRGCRPHAGASAGRGETMTIPFLKMQGAANDFVVIDHRRPILPEEEERRGALLRRMCDRRRGVGADGVLLLERAGGADFAMRYFNADGLPADFCGNGARCLARLALDLGLGNGEEVRFESAAGVQRARRAADGRAIELLFGMVEAAGPVESVAALNRSFAGRRA